MWLSSQNTNHLDSVSWPHLIHHISMSDHDHTHRCLTLRHILRYFLKLDCLSVNEVAHVMNQIHRPFLIATLTSVRLLDATSHMLHFLCTLTHWATEVSSVKRRGNITHSDHNAFNLHQWHNVLRPQFSEQTGGRKVVRYNAYLSSGRGVRVHF